MAGQIPSRVPNAPVDPRTGQTFADARRPNWRARLQIASFKSQPFYVDQQGRSSGRRTVVHQYPKRDLPYAEDMGREAMRYQITGYLLMAPNWTASNTYYGMLSNYDEARDALEAALLSKSPGKLVDPYNPRLQMTGYGAAGPLLFMCERYTISESRERGGMCTLEMSFVEGGIPGNTYVTSDTIGAVNQAADNANNAAASETNAEQKQFNENLERELRESGL